MDSTPEQPLAPPPFEPQQPEALPPPKPSTLRRIFMGRFGLRAGWGIAIFIVVVAILTTIAGVIAVAANGQLKEAIAIQMQAKAHPNLPKPVLHIRFAPTLAIVSDGIQFLGMAAMCFVFCKTERRPFGTYGIGKSRRMDFFPGAFWGLAALSLLVFALHAAHVLVFDARILHGSAVLFYALKWLFAFLMVGFSEEYQLRGYLQFTLTRGVYGLAEKLSPQKARLVAFWIAAVIMSLLFGALHLGNAGENALGIGQVVLVGLVFSYVLWRTGSLWWAIGFHMAWDWAQSFLYGVPDSGNISVGRLFQTHAPGRPLLSGGVDGPEGSVLCIPVMLLVLVIVRYTTRLGVQPPLEPEPPAVDAPPTVGISSAASPVI